MIYAITGLMTGNHHLQLYDSAESYRHRECGRSICVASGGEGQCKQHHHMNDNIHTAYHSSCADRSSSSE